MRRAGCGFCFAAAGDLTRPASLACFTATGARSRRVSCVNSSLADRDLVCQGRLTWSWLALCASSPCSRALRFAVSSGERDPARRSRARRSRAARREPCRETEPCSRTNPSACRCCARFSSRSSRFRVCFRGEPRKLDRAHPHLGVTRSRSPRVATTTETGETGAQLFVNKPRTRDASAASGSGTKQSTRNNPSCRKSSPNAPTELEATGRYSSAPTSARG